MVKQKNVTINETEYTLQQVNALEWIRLRERSHKNGVLSQEMFYRELLEHVVVNPKRKIEDFDEYMELEELMGEAVSLHIPR